MSNFKHSDSSFKNEDTVRRRAWIDLAVESVKERVTDDDAGSCTTGTTDAPTRPRLYIVGSNPEN